MSSSSERGRVLRGSAAEGLLLAPLDTELESITLAVTSEETGLPSFGDDTDEADDLLGPSHDAGYEAGYFAGFGEGRAVGYADGYQAGNEAAALAAERSSREREALLKEALAALYAAAEACNGRMGVTVEEVEEAIVTAAVEIGEALLGRELTIANDIGKVALARALALAPNSRPVRAFLNPQDIATIGSVEDVAPGRSVEILGDPSVEPGGCVLEAGPTKVDAQLDAAIRRVRRVLDRFEPEDRGGSWA